MNIFNKYQGKVETHISINENKNKVYNIHLNPNVANPTAPSPFNNREVNYNYDFTTMPEGKYRVSFTYVGEFQRNRMENFSKEDIEVTRPYIFCDLGQANSYMPDDRTASNVRHQNTTFLGVLQQRETPLISDSSIWDLNFFSATDQNNPPIYLNNRPSKNEINVKITEYDETSLTNSFPRFQVSGGISQYSANYNRFLKDYHMTLHFELLEEKYYIAIV